MKFTFFLTILLISILSCVKHEVIPAPIPTVILSAKFTATINGISTVFEDGVLGYSCNPTQEKNLVTSPLLSTAIVYSKIGSTQATESIQIALGKINWDAAKSTELTLPSFNSFFKDPLNVLPKYKDDHSSGFSAKYIDKSGTIYTSRDTSSRYKSVKFSNITQESDATGDYSKFVCTFNCYVYYLSGPNPANNLDSIQIQNAQFKGWFKK